MRLLILGGTAFLSATVARLALSRGHEVTCLARGSTQPPPSGTRWLQADRQNGTDAYRDARGDWDAVIDVARDPRQARAAVRLLGPRAAHWTFVSSGSVYAHHDDPAGSDESADLLPALGSVEVGENETYGAGKVACEQACLEVLADRLHLSRAGLIAGQGDPTDRFGYWPARFARGSGDDVLVPDAAALSTQVIAVADLAGWLLDAVARGVVGALNAYGDPIPFGQVLDLAQETAGHRGRQVRVACDWLVEQQVAYWAGPESLPLWLPADYTGFGARSNEAAKRAGMRLSGVRGLMEESLAYERELGLDRRRTAGLSPGREAELLAAWRARSE